jgi:hypothetical protein
MAPRPPSPAQHAPPDLPSMPDVSTTLTNYLRTFALWCRNGFQDRLPAHSALPGILLQANDATGKPIPGAVFMLTIQATPGVTPSAPVISMTLVVSGGGAP